VLVRGFGGARTLGEGRTFASDSEERSALIHRETFQLSALVALAVAAFLVTRAVAANNRDMSLRDAAEWFRRGQEAMQSGRVDDAIDSLRRATVRNRNEKSYVLALAHALALKHDADAARTVLMTLRESEPEDRDINLQLARLAATQQDVTEAVRFYHNALYAPWPLDQTDARRGVRLELVRLLLAHNQAGRAISELLALSADMPDDPAPRLEVAQLFADAHDDSHALDQFQRALSRVPDNRIALSGAGMAAFRHGDYALARSYLQRLPEDAGEVRTTRELVNLIISRDPLANRIGAAERPRRLTADINYVHERIHACIANGNVNTDSATLDSEAEMFGAELDRPVILEQDTVEEGVDLINRLEHDMNTRCGRPTTLDQALLLIGNRHETDVK
jgi:tetratricopeptide (TPR) repeat protein